MPDARHGNKTEHDFCPGGGTVNQYSESKVGGLTLDDWEYTETSDKITLTKYKGDKVNVVIPSEFEGHEGKTVEIKTFDGMFENLKKEDSSDEVQKYNELVSLKVGTTDKKVILGTDTLELAFSDLFDYYFTNLETVDLSGLDTSNVTDMFAMFMYCFSLKEIKGLETLDTGKVTNMMGMFSHCKSLEHIDLSNFDTKNVTTMMGMFSGCANLENLDLSNFNTDKVKFMTTMFMYCTKLKNIKGFENFNTSACKDYQAIFFGCDQLNIFDIGNFEIDETNISSIPDIVPALFVSTKTPAAEINTVFPNIIPLDESIPTIIISRSEYLLQNIDSSNNPALIFSRTPYYAKVVYHSNDGVFTDGSTSNEKMLYQSDHIIYSTMEEAKKDFTFTGTEIVKDSPVVSAGKERMGVAWYLDEACTKPLTETDTVDFTTLENGTLQLYAGYKEETPEEPETPEEKPTEPEETPSEPEEKPTEPEEKPNTPNEEEKGESNIEEIKKEESEAVHTGDEVSKGMYYVLLGGSMIVFAAMLRKNRRSEQ